VGGGGLLGCRLETRTRPSGASTPKKLTTGQETRRSRRGFGYREKPSIGGAISNRTKRHRVTRTLEEKDQGKLQLNGQRLRKGVPSGGKGQRKVNAQTTLNASWFVTKRPRTEGRV